MMMCRGGTIGYGERIVQVGRWLVVQAVAGRLERHFGRPGHYGVAIAEAGKLNLVQQPFHRAVQADGRGGLMGQMATERWC